MRITPIFILNLFLFIIFSSCKKDQGESENYTGKYTMNTRITSYCGSSFTLDSIYFIGTIERNTSGNYRVHFSPKLSIIICNDTTQDSGYRNVIIQNGIISNAEQTNQYCHFNGYFINENEFTMDFGCGHGGGVNYLINGKR